VGLTGKGKGSRLMLATDANGLPLGMLTTSAGVSEVRMAEATLATIAVPQKKGKPKSRPRQLIADKGYDSRTLRQSLHLRGIRPCIPPKRRPKNWKPRQGRPVKQYTEEYRRRWPVERTFAWLGHQRRLLVRHEHKAANFHAFYTLACIRLALMASVQCARL
jgi:transposase